MQKIYLRFNKRLQLVLLDREMTQQALSQSTGIPASVISLFVTGARKPSFDNLIKLCQSLGISSDYLLGINDTMNTTTKYNIKEAIRLLENGIKKLKDCK